MACDREELRENIRRMRLVASIPPLAPISLLYSSPFATPYSFHSSAKKLILFDLNQKVSLIGESRNREVCFDYRQKFLLLTSLNASNPAIIFDYKCGFLMHYSITSQIKGCRGFNYRVLNKATA